MKVEFSEKLRKLRKEKLLTQEELAEALYVSRTAVSKWESGRGYPSIDSLRELSRFFSVSIDELICPDEIIEAAADEKRAFVNSYRSLICGALDMLLAVLLFIPAFGNGADSTATVALFELTGVSSWLRFTFVAIICAVVLEGACSLVASKLDAQTWGKRLLVAGMVLSVAAVMVFIMSRQPYAGIVCFALLTIKGLLITQGK